MSNDILPPGPGNRIVLYNAADGKVTVNVFFARDNFWLPQRAIAELFGVRVAGISKHLKNIFESGELSPDATVSKMETVQIGSGRQVTRRILQREHCDSGGLRRQFDQAPAQYVKGGSKE